MFLHNRKGIAAPPASASRFRLAVRDDDEHLVDRFVIAWGYSEPSDDNAPGSAFDNRLPGQVNALQILEVLVKQLRFPAENLAA